MKRKGTSTTKFGVSKRESHNSDAFYGRKMYGQPRNESQQTDAVPLPEEACDRIFCSDSRTMRELPDGCIALAVTSPPYNVGKDYDDDLTLDDYRQLLRDVFAETYRVLVPGGRLAVNVANLGRKPYIPLNAFITQDLLQIGYLMRGEIIWNKSASSGGSCAWGSWMSASNPTLRDVHEYIMVFCKGMYKRDKKDRVNTVGRDEFLDYTKSVWEFPTESARKVGHPAPFPVELPRRLVQLYTFEDDAVLDPFCGSGSTCLAAAQHNRRYVGYDIDSGYAQLARDRLLEWRRREEGRLL